MEAAAYVRAALLDCLPDGVPPSFSEIVSARWEGRAPRRIAVASLTMFDGHPGVVEVRQVGPCTSHRFTDLPGGDCSYEGGRWVRVDNLQAEQGAK